MNHTIFFNLTNEEIELLRKVTSDLGFENPVGVSLQLKIANALLDSGYKQKIEQIPYKDNPPPNYVKIPVEIFNGGGIDCLSETCCYKKECANHTTAGDFRSENGFTPKLHLVSGDVPANPEITIYCGSCNELSNDFFEGSGSLNETTNRGAVIMDHLTGEIGSF